MKLQAFTKALISQGTVGTANSEGALDSSFLSKIDEVLRFKIQDIQDQAAFHIGSMYENGIGVKQDIQQALAWYKKAV